MASRCVLLTGGLSILPYSELIEKDGEIPMSNMLKMKRSFLLAVAAGCVFTPTALADTLLVPSQFPTIQSAIDAAVNFDEIVVSPGTYFEALDFQGKTISLRSTGGAGSTTINGAGQPVSTISVFGTGAGTEIEGFTIIGSQGTSDGSNSYGGAIYVIGATLEIRDSVLRDGFVTGLGGAVYMELGSVVTVSNSEFLNNSVDDTGTAGVNTGRGGAISSRGTSELNITNSTFSNNSANLFGGAIEWTATTGSITSSEFTNNTSPVEAGGGAVFVLNGTVDITDTDFTGNIADRGGAVHFNSNGFGTVTGCTFENNTSVGNTFGGAIYAISTTSADPSAEVTIIDCDFNNNIAIGATGRAGAVYATASTAGTPGVIRVFDSRFSGNTATQHGGVGYSLNADLDFTGCTMTNNSAVVDGGAVYYSSGGRGSIDDSIISGNSAVRGGGVVSFRGVANISNTTFDSNNASFRGGAIALLASTVGPGEAYLDNVTITNHTVPDDGGGFYALRGIGVIENSTISNNSASRGGGIGAFATTTGGSEITVINSSVTNNSASSTGGGMYSLRAEIDIQGSSFSNNNATGAAGRGGGLAFAATASGGSIVTLNDVTLEGNTAEEFGGGMGISGSTTVVNGDRVRIVGNEAVFLDAGGLTISGGTVNLSNLLVADNTGTNFGGSGISMSGSADVTITNATIYGNRNAFALAAIAEGGTLTLNNSILWDNDGSSGIDPVVNATVSHSIIQGGFAGTNVLNVNPQLADPNNGDYALSAGSPAIDAGSNALAAGLTLDLAGNARISNGVVDMGAFEFQDGPAECLGDIADDFGFTVNDGGGPDGVVDFGDFVALLGLIGPCPGGTPGCLGDIADDFGFTAPDGGGPDGVVDFGDFVALLGLIGPCP